MPERHAKAMRGTASACGHWLGQTGARLDPANLSIIADLNGMRRGWPAASLEAGAS
jgi:hypothetical protein